MVHHFDLILTLTGGLIAALVFGLAAQRLKLSPIVGYLLAGVAVGPHTPGFVAEGHIAEQLAEIGVILLMFGVGLHFHLKDLLAVRRIALPGAVFQIATATGLGVLIARWAGWDVGAGLVFGLAVSVASTVVLLRVLADHDQLHTPSGHVAVGWLLVEDIFTVIVLVVLPSLVGEQRESASADVALSLSLAMLKVGALVLFTFVVARRAIPKLLGYVARTRSRELFTLTVLALALGLAVGSATLFGASMALGAFLAGMVVGQSDFGTRAASEALPMRDAFAVLFFVAMGMLFDPSELLPHAGLIAATVLLVVVAKPVAALLVVLVLRRPAKTAFTVAIALAQIGEFSFILAALGRQLEILPAEATQTLVAAAIVSITANPLLFKLIDPLSKWVTTMRPKLGTESPIVHAPSSSHRAVVVGYGPVGRLVVSLLKENGLHPTVVELNHETVRELQDIGLHAIYGDATQREVLTKAGAAQGAYLIFAAAGAPDGVIRTAKELNPEIQILARATFVSETQALRRAGADAVVVGEEEIAAEMAVRVLDHLGASADQLDRARDRARSELSRPRSQARA